MLETLLRIIHLAQMQGKEPTTMSIPASWYYRLHKELIVDENTSYPEYYGVGKTKVYAHDDDFFSMEFEREKA